MRNRTILVGCALLAGACVRAGAEEGSNQMPASIGPGARIRVWTLDPGGTPIVGVVATLDARQVVLLAEKAAAPVTLSRDAIKRLEVSLGKKGNAGKGALIGLGAGWAVLFLLVSSSSSGGYVGECAPVEQCAALAATIVGAPAGAAAGALIGSLAKSERWQDVAPLASPQAFVPRRTNRPLLSISLRF